jgi:hypothetical protein
MTKLHHLRRAGPCLGLAAALALAPIVANAAGSADTGGRPLSTSMSGPVEVPPGDPDGTGTFKATVNLGQGKVCYEITVQNIDAATMAHIHRAAPGVAGPIVVPLTPPTSGSSSGCADITKDLAKDLIQTPDAFYVNVHNTPFPAGAVRGQLAK